MEEASVIVHNSKASLLTSQVLRRTDVSGKGARKPRFLVTGSSFKPCPFQITLDVRLGLGRSQKPKIPMEAKLPA